MLRVYRQRDGHLEPTELQVTSQSTPEDGKGAVWIDLLNPTQDEDHYVERLLGISIPTQEEARDIEVSARLYHEDGAEYMTMTSASQLETDAPMTAPITFVLKDQTLVTIRYTEPKPFWTYATRVQKPGTVSCFSGEQIMLGLVEEMIGRMAEAIEMVGRDLQKLSQEIFRSKSAHAPPDRSRNFQVIIERLGVKGDLLATIRESLVSLNRLLAYHTTIGKSAQGPNKDAAEWVKALTQDVTALSDHGTYLSNKTSFLLDATLGLINLEQNQIIKIFSIAAVVLLPPTLIATIYGMNFKRMPELEWVLGYPWALSLIVVSAILPYLWFKRRGWL
jgi:magnesium transporter